ncbi:isopeptide-forming domain-containing fimbrial protein [Candidatus Saccharibacteria bacterium]|nr:isopeptide-forming domain-containing fimbrial protein [Candidatus Saccharibacteria bacterium]
MKKTFQTTKLLTLTLGLAAFSLAGNMFTPSPASALVDTPWGPERTTFTWDDPAPYATFNSITDNPSVGDERNFVRIREVSDDEHYKDEVELEVGKTYEVYIYYHNNADAHEVGKTAIGIADGASVKSSFPATVKAGEKATVSATVFAADTDPLAVWDGAYMTSTQDVYLRYVPGTAIIHNGGTLDGTSIGPDYLFGDGALLGYNKFSGLLPGCNEYAGYITYQIFVDAPGFDISKSVVGDATTVERGGVVTFKVRYQNTGTMDQTNVVIRDVLPDGLEYVAGSAKLYNNNLTEGKAVNDDIISENGMNIGDYAGGTGWAEVTYQAVVKDDVNCGDELTNAVTVSTNDGNKNAGLTLTVTGDECNVVVKTCKTNPEMEGCQELPSTGPLEIVMASVIALGIAGGGYYVYRTRKTLRQYEAAAKGAGRTDQIAEDSSQKPDNMVE